MPAKSKAQQRFMAMCAHEPAHTRGTCPDMPRKSLREFASTPTKGLPKRVTRA